jgi:hypothetical protein
LSQGNLLDDIMIWTKKIPPIIEGKCSVKFW